MTWFRQLLGAWAALALTAGLSGCASVGAPLPPSLELPRPPGDLRAARKGDQVTLSWSVPLRTVDRQTLRRRGPTLICRSPRVTMSACGAPIGEVAPLPAANQPPASGKIGATFVDTLPADLQQENPTRTATYAVEVLNDSNRGAGLSNQVRVPLAPTLPPPPDFQAQMTADGVVLTWALESPASSGADLQYLYRVYRRRQGSPERSDIGEIALGTESHPTLVDRTFAWDTSYEYWITVVTHVETASQPCPAGPDAAPCTPITVEGADSPPITIFTHDVFPPAVPSGLQAVFSGPGQTPFIDLIWAPDTDADLAGYNVFRREQGGTPVKINSALIKTPSYRDKDVAPGKTFWYSVSAVDERGNESARSNEASERVP